MSTYEAIENVKNLKCIQGADFTEKEVEEGLYRAASAIFEVPIVETVFFFARGDKSGGSINLKTSPSQASDFVKVEVVTRYIRKEIRDLVRICLSTMGEGRLGVVAYTPTNYVCPYQKADDDMCFETEITFPQGFKDAPFIINSFETDVKETSHSIGNFSLTCFTNIKLSSSNGAIISELLNAEKLILKTTNAPILGEFKATRSIDLTTSNDTIKVRMGLLYHTDSNKAVSVDIKNSNGGIEAKVFAFSTTETSPSIFQVAANTTKGPLVISFLRAPVSSQLTVKATTSEYPAYISIPNTYEGDFAIETTPGPFEKIINVESQRGGKRGRCVRTKCYDEGNGTSGEIIWPWINQGSGNVFLRTTDADVVLNFPK